MAAAPKPRATRARKAVRTSEYRLNYGDFLDAHLDDPGKRKGARTRDRLKAATIRLLDRAGYRDLRVTDINELAGVSNALFYVYFKNKEEITKEVLTEFLAYFSRFTEGVEKPGSIDESIYLGNLRYSQMFCSNAGLMRCLFQFSDEFPAFLADWQAWNWAWRNRVTRSLQRSEELMIKDSAELKFAVMTLGMMVDGLLRAAFVQKEPVVVQEPWGSSPEDIALFLTRLWVLSLFGREMQWRPKAAAQPSR